jgi:hypothetical protein
MTIERNLPMELLMLILALAGCVFVLGLVGVMVWAFIQELNK